MPLTQLRWFFHTVIYNNLILSGLTNKHAKIENLGAAVISQTKLMPGYAFSAG